MTSRATPAASRNAARHAFEFAAPASEHARTDARMVSDVGRERWAHPIGLVDRLHVEHPVTKECRSGPLDVTEDRGMTVGGDHFGRSSGPLDQGRGHLSALGDAVAGPRDARLAQIRADRLEMILEGLIDPIEDLLKVGHRASSAMTCRASGCCAAQIKVVTGEVLHLSKCSVIRSFVPTSATSSTNSSGTAAIAPTLSPAR